jgi:sirohydrochlorin ferrochelatase
MDRRDPPPSSRGPGRRPFKAVARVRIPLGVQQFRSRAFSTKSVRSTALFEMSSVFGPVAQLVSAPPCHGGGRRFEPGRGRHMSGDASILLLVTHGTRSRDGRAQLDDLAAHVQAARPGIRVELCFVDVLEPDLPSALDELAGRPVVVVPALLSTGHHVQHDIPAATAERAYVHVARHLGPHPLLALALAERLRDAVDPIPESVVLIGSGSSEPAAGPELEQAGAYLAREISRPVTVLTMNDDLAGELALRSADGPVAVATYLLAEGHFAAKARAEAAEAGGLVVAAPLGAHPAVVELILARYDAVIDAATVR